LNNLVEFYNILLEEHIPVALRDVGGGNLFPILLSKADHSGSVMVKTGDCAGLEADVHLHALQTMTEQFQL
jgi:hypothetical protein